MLAPQIQGHVYFLFQGRGGVHRQVVQCTQNPGLLELFLAGFTRFEVIDLFIDTSGQLFQKHALIAVERSWPGVYDAESAQAITFMAAELSTGVEANVWRAGNERVIGKS